MKIDIQEKKIPKFTLDFFYYNFGYYFFYKDIYGCLIISLIMVTLFIKSKIYNKSIEDLHFFEFIDFLNALYSHLSVGMTWSASVLELDHSAHSKHLNQIILDVKKTVAYAQNDDLVYEKIDEGFTIIESTLFVQMLKQSKYTGFAISDIVGIILEQLQLKTKLKREIQTILFQKKLEQSILSVAPILILACIQYMQPSYLDPLYENIKGRLIMTLAFTIILFMKFFSEKIVQIKTE